MNEKTITVWKLVYRQNNKIYSINKRHNIEGYPWQQYNTKIRNYPKLTNSAIFAFESAERARQFAVEHGLDNECCSLYECTALEDTRNNYIIPYHNIKPGVAEDLWTLPSDKFDKKYTKWSKDTPPDKTVTCRWIEFNQRIEL